MTTLIPAILSMTIILFIIIVNMFFFKDVLFPATIHALLWLLIIFFYKLNQSHFIPISNLTYFIVTNGVFMFSIGCFVGTLCIKNGQKYIEIHSISVNKMVSNILYWISLTGFPVFLIKALEIANQGPFSSFFINLRYSYNFLGADYGVMIYLLTISIISMGIQLFEHIHQRNLFKFLTSLLLSLSYSLLATGRTYFVLIFVVIIGILVIMKKISPIRGLLYMIAISMIIFISLGFLLGKGADLTKNYVENQQSISDSLRVYLLGALPAFDLYMQSHQSIDYGKNMFRFIFALLNRLGMEIKVPELVQGYQSVPMQTNVYTFYQPHYADFGLTGPILIQFLFGMWHGFLYRMANFGKPVYILLYSFFLYPLIMQFFQDQYFNILSTWIQYALIIGVYSVGIKYVDTKEAVQVE